MAFVGLTKLGEDVPRLTPLSFKEKFNNFIDTTEQKIEVLYNEHEFLINLVASIALMALSVVGIVFFCITFAEAPLAPFFFGVCVIYVPSVCGVVGSLSILFDLTL